MPSPGDLSNPGIKPSSPTLQANSLLSESPGTPPACHRVQPKQSKTNPENVIEGIFFFYVLDKVTKLFPFWKKENKAIFMDLIV